MYEIGEEEIEAIAAVIRSGHLFRYYAKDAPDIGHRGEANQFEAELAAFTGTTHAVAVTNGSAALQCAFAALGIGSGDEVIVPSFTFVATALAVLAVGAVPVVADIDESLTLDVRDCERKITERTRAIVPVHMAGLPCNMAAILELTAHRKIAVVEDACQAMGGTYRGRPLGSIGDIGCYSFNQFKAITCGEGGALVTRDRRSYERALIYHDPGYSFISAGIAISEPRFAGFNFRTNEIQAAMLRVQLRKLPAWIDALKEMRRDLRAGLRGHPLL
ncbi:MAG TPA: DegT/DnrJ/EryC1/StrS family aminotransferase, partial [Labilithrix sp.]|nr:DegT/DnrJ/EryC1/StrS family aminotransferase [Labilithrix sp.]